MRKIWREYELFVQVRLRENYSGAFISTTGLIALGLVSTVIIATSFALVRSIESVERFPESNLKQSAKYLIILNGWILAV